MIFAFMPRDHSLRLAVLTATVSLLIPASVWAQGTQTKSQFSCAAAPQPVVSLAIGSRYAADSATRSEISEQSNDEVNKALEPVEDFITDLSALANGAAAGGADAQAQADCAMAWLDAWAEGNALSELKSLNARLAVSPRLAGFALAYLQAHGRATPDAARDDRIKSWLQEGATDVREFFDNEAGQLASRNNLRAWAALATAAISDVTGDQELRAWATDSYRLLVCNAEDSGALPAEMERGERALHYQLHAVAPLAVAQGILDPEGTQADKMCENDFDRIVAFTTAAVKDPSLVADIVGEDQVFSGDNKTEIEPYQMAWAEPYLAKHNNQTLEQYIEPLRPLRYSKLGGNLTQIYTGEVTTTN